MVDRLVLGERQRVVGAVHRRARRVDQVRDARVAAAFEHVAEGVDVGAQVRGGIDERVAHARLRGKVDDAVEAPVAEQPRGRVALGEVEPLEREARAAREAVARRASFSATS